ncbi:MAG: DUF4160 domain-containing protein [Candidatus Moduliflexus flocculans]|nr:DUF4160 domain-containing protein [Candidatus Moduliflexus flocculans]
MFRERGYRFYFFSREESRMHVHVYHADGEAKFWLEPTVELAQNFGLSAKELREAEGLVRSREPLYRTKINLLKIKIKNCNCFESFRFSRFMLS